MSVLFSLPTIVLVATTSFCSAAPSEFQMTCNDGIEGAIIPAETLRHWRVQYGRDVNGMTEAEEFWTPSTEQIGSIETQLRATFEKGAIDPEILNLPLPRQPPGVWITLQTNAYRILAEYGAYHRQYVGVIIGGKRQILVNAFHDEARDDYGYTKKYVMVFDGGFWFWHALYDMDERRFLWVTVQG